VPVPVYWLRQSGAFSSLRDLGRLQTTLPYDQEMGLLQAAREGTAAYALLD
jgi:hypothetical protein